MSDGYARRILNQTDDSVKAENQRVQKLAAIRDSVASLKKEAKQLAQDISRQELKILINSDQWETIGEVYGFTPKYCEFQGRRTFNWQSCSVAFWEAFKPVQIGDLSESRIYLKALGENELVKHPHRKPKPKPIPKGTRTKPPRIKLKVVHELQVVVPVTAPVGIWMSKRKSRRGRRIYEPEELDFINRLVWLKTLGHCFYCRAPLTAKLFVSNMVKDHFIPLNCGGPDDHSNLVPSCRPCDKSKGGKLPIGLPRAIREKYVQRRR